MMIAPSDEVLVRVSMICLEVRGGVVVVGSSGSVEVRVVSVVSGAVRDDSMVLDR